MPLRVCYPLVGDSVGGAQVSTATLVRALPADIDPVVVLHQDGPLSDYLREQGVSYRLLPLPQIAGRQTSALGQLRALASTSPRLARLLSSEHIDIVHTQDGRMHVSWAAAAALRRTAHVWHQRTHHFPSRLVDYFMRRADAIIAISHAARASLPAAEAKRAQVIFNPVSAPSCTRSSVDARAALLRTADLPETAGSEDPLIVAAVGNLREVKQPLLLASAVAEMALQSGRTVLLSVFGYDHEGYIPEMRRMLENAGGGARLAHLGFRSPIEDWLSGCDLLLATSSGDAFGRTLVEAMAVGLPVVAVDAGGHAEIVTNSVNGILIADRNPKALAAAALSVASDGAKRASLIAGGYQRATCFAPERHSDAVIAVYRGLEGRG